MTPSPRRLLFASASLVFLSGIVLAARPSRAAVLEALPLDELTRRADLVVHGEVLGQTVRRDPDGRTMWTATQLKVLEALKGAAPTGPLSFEQLGGTLNGVTQLIPGDAAFRPGEEVVVFLSKTTKGYVLYGFSLGKFTVGYDPVVDGPIVTRDLSGVGLVVRPGQRPQPSYAPARLDDFRAEIRSYAHR